MDASSFDGHAVSPFIDVDDAKASDGSAPRPDVSIVAIPLDPGCTFRESAIHLIVRPALGPATQETPLLSFNSTDYRPWLEWHQTEDNTIRSMYAQLGAQWSIIAAQIPGRTGDAVRNRFRRLQQRAIRRPAEDVQCSGPKQPHTCSRWTAEEDRLIRQGVKTYGSQWRKVAAGLVGRSESSVRNRYKRLCQELESSPGTVAVDSSPEAVAVHSSSASVAVDGSPASVPADSSPVTVEPDDSGMALHELPAPEREADEQLGGIRSEELSELIDIFFDGPTRDPALKCISSKRQKVAQCWQGRASAVPGSTLSRVRVRLTFNPCTRALPAAF